jgi:hypothetical protein
MRNASPPILLTTLGELEMLNALSLQLFRKEFTREEIEQAHRAFAKDVSTGVFHRISVPAGAYERAALMARRHTPELGTRTLDVLHVASALTLNASTFYTFDHRQRVLAKREGMIVP